MSMTLQHCSECGVTAWHNPTGKKDGKPRCTYCGYPAGGPPNSDKKALQQAIIKAQAARAKLFGLSKIHPI